MFAFNFFDDPVTEEQSNAMDVDPQETAQICALRLEDILEQLPNTLAYSLLGGLPRRELWHVKMQMMQDDRYEYLLGDSDVIKGSYEGGLKTWECSVDLADYLSHQTHPPHMSVLELGCGSALPTARLFAQALRDGNRWKFVLQDYNDIFGLVTVPNLFLTWYVSEHGASISDEIDITPELKQKFLDKLHECGVQFEFIVGAWGIELTVRLVVLVNSKKVLSKYDLILSSEGIYSPQSLPQFTDLLVTCLGGHALVAAKKLYFDVGGGVAEFLDELAKHNRTGQIVWEGGQVGRVIIQI